MILITTGGRDYRLRPADYGLLHALRPEYIFVGDCPTGADQHVWNWVETGGICKGSQIKAEWNTLGLSAGPERNGRMLHEAVQMAIDTGNYALLLAFPGERDTDNCIDQAQRRGIPVVRADNAR